MSGVVTTIITCLFDTLKIAEQQHLKRLYNFTEILKTYKNLPISLMRKVTGNVIFFSTYYKTKKNNLPYFFVEAWLDVYLDK